MLAGGKVLNLPLNWGPCCLYPCTAVKLQLILDFYSLYLKVP